MMPSLIAFILLAAVVCAAAWTDVRKQKVYNKLTYPAMFAGVLLWTLAGFFQVETLHGGVPHGHRWESTCRINMRLGKQQLTR